MPKPKPNPTLTRVAKSTAAPLQKQKSWSPDTVREEVWQRRKERGLRRSKSLTDEDFEELKGCIELGFRFGFESPESDQVQRLSNTLPALPFYYAVNKSYNDTVLKMSSSSSSSLAKTSSFSSESDLSLSSPVGSPLTMFSAGDDPKTIKTRLRQWAQAVACVVKHS